jgi:tetratricopeptide (TPR) repeat protein
MNKAKSTTRLMSTGVWSWMWKYPKNLLKKFGNILIPDLHPAIFFPQKIDLRTVPLLALLSIAIFVFFLAGCVDKTALHPPKTPLESPTASINAPPDKSFQKGYVEYQKGNQNGARREFQKVLKNSPDYSPAYLAIGYTYLADENLDQAEQYIRKSLEITPEYLQAHFALAHLLEMKQDYDGAVAELNEVEKLDPNYPSIQQTRNILKLKSTEQHLSHARALAESNPDEALNNLQRAREIAPEIPEIPLQIATILIHQDKCEEAVPYLEEAMKQAPDNLEIQKQLAACMESLKNYERAISLYQAIYAEEPPGPEGPKKIEMLQKKLAIQRLPEEFHTISSTDQISRSQLAALIIVNLEFLSKYKSLNSSIIVDTFDNWAKNFIQRCVDLGIMDIYPNRTFQPELPITKLELAKAASRLMEILETNKGVQVKKSEITVPDVSTRNIYGPMIAQTVSAGLLSLDADGNFHPARPVSGAEAISMVNRVQSIEEGL